MNRVVDEHELWIERHDAFHDYLHYWSGRPRLVAQIRQLRAAVQPYLRLYVEWKTQTEKHGYEHEEIAEMLKVSIGTSKSQLHKARMRLRDLLKRTTVS